MKTRSSVIQGATYDGQNYLELMLGLCPALKVCIYFNCYENSHEYQRPLHNYRGVSLQGIVLCSHDVVFRYFVHKYCFSNSRSFVYHRIKHA
jgi:hypothetical protein